jgi:hypothetical protein
MEGQTLFRDLNPEDICKQMSNLILARTYDAELSYPDTDIEGMVHLHFSPDIDQEYWFTHQFRYNGELFEAQYSFCCYPHEISSDEVECYQHAVASSLNSSSYNPEDQHYGIKVYKARNQS